MEASRSAIRVMHCWPIRRAVGRNGSQSFGRLASGSVSGRRLSSSRRVCSRLRLPCKVWAIVGVSPQGRDDRGRPGALGFHGLFLTDREYRRAGASPFALTPALRSDWTAETTTLPTGVLSVVLEEEVIPNDHASQIALALANGRRVVIESPTPIDELARNVWSLLPPRLRARRTVATLAFGNTNRFDFLAVPRLAGVSLDSSYNLETDPVAAVSAP